MATTKKTTRRKPVSRSTATTRKRTAPRAASPSTDSFFVRMYRHPFGKAVLFLACVIVVISLNLLVTLNHFELFFILLGIEWSAATLSGWILFVFKEKLKNGNRG